MARTGYEPNPKPYWNQNEQNFFIFTYDETNTDKLGK